MFMYRHTHFIFINFLFLLQLDAMIDILLFGCGDDDTTRHHPSLHTHRTMAYYEDRMLRWAFSPGIIRPGSKTPTCPPTTAKTLVSTHRINKGGEGGGDGGREGGWNVHGLPRPGNGGRWGPPINILLNNECQLNGMNNVIYVI